MSSTLVATRYVPPGSFIGQLITPRPGQISPEARLPCYIGQGNRLALGTNLPIKRSFIFAQQLNFSPTAPFLATLAFAGDGDQQAARLFKTDGTEVRADQWAYQTNTVANDRVLINTEVFDASATYFFDYQSTSRLVTDEVPVEELREIVAVGNQVDKPQFTEFTHFFIETEITTPLGDAGNTNPASSLPAAPTADGGNSGTAVVGFAGSAQYNHSYTRRYETEVTAKVPGVKATGTITNPVGGSLVDGETFTLDDGVNTPTVFEFDSDATLSVPTNIAVTFTGSDSNTVVAGAIRAAINGVGSTLLITASDGGAGVNDLEADNFGTLANNAIVDTVSDGGFIVVGMASGVARTATFEWFSEAISPGNASLPDTPLDVRATVPVSGNPTFIFSDDVAGSATPLLELGIRLDLDLGTVAVLTPEVADKWTFFADGPALYEEDIRYGNTNQFATIDTPVADSGNSGAAGSGVSVDVTADFNGTFNADYTLEVTAFANTAPGTRTATFAWGEAGDNVDIQGNFLADEASPASLIQTLSKSVILDIDFPTGAGNFAVGDKFTVQASSAKIFYEAKDNRSYELTTNAATNPSPGTGFVSGSFVTNTPEGSFGTFEATGAIDNTTDGHFTLPNNVLLAARNLFWTTAMGNRHVAVDLHTFAATQTGNINWTLDERVDETIEADLILTDVNGTVTGTTNTKYVTISQTPIQVNSVVEEDSGDPITFTHIAGTPYVTFVTDPGEAIVVNYDWRSAEPDPGQTYFLTAKFLRPPESFNTPTLVLDRQDGRTFLAPASVDNHLFIMNEIAFDNGAPGAFYIQVSDPDDDGIFTIADFNEAIIASEAPRRITDLVVLSKFDATGILLASINRMNDPFERRERLGWFGMPIGTPIGDATTPDTLVFTAKNTLQVFGNSPAHGTRILVGSTEASREIRLEDGSTISVTVDGSFIAGGMAALTDSFQDPGETILRKQLAGFLTMETFGDIEDPRNLILGTNQIIFLTDRGAGVFRLEEDITTDSFADDFKFINSMTQKQFVVKSIRTQVDNSLVSIVVPSAQAGIGLVKGFVVGAVASIVSRGIVGRFQDADGNERPIDPEADVVVFRDDTDPTLYHFFFAFWLKTTIKRLFGLFSVNSNDFGLLRG